MPSSGQGHLQLLTLRFDRRTLMKLGLGTGGLVLLGGGAAAWGLLSHPLPAPGRQVLGEEEMRFLEALADAHFPPGNALGVAAQDLSLAEDIDAWVGSFAASEQRVVRTLFALIDLWPRLSLSGLRRFSALDRAERVEMLRAFDESSLDLRRALGQLLRIVVSMPFFEQAPVLAAMGHRFGCHPIPPEGAAEATP